jgi:hypothetical protein
VWGKSVEGLRQQAGGHQHPSQLFVKFSIRNNDCSDWRPQQGAWNRTIKDSRWSSSSFWSRRSEGTEPNPPRHLFSRVRLGHSLRIVSSEDPGHQHICFNCFQVDGRPEHPKRYSLWCFGTVCLRDQCLFQLNLENRSRCEYFGHLCNGCLFGRSTTADCCYS